MAKWDWIACGGAVPAAAITLISATMAAGLPAAAEDWPDHDSRIEKWAAERVSGRLGDLRGSFGHLQDVRQVIASDGAGKPKPPFKPATRIYVVPQTGETLPPVVRNQLPPAGVDPVMTGSTPGVPPGVDPIITGSNAHPTGAVRSGPAQSRKPSYPINTSMLLN